jgi:carbon monoxide dehydrogenase subunit G
MEHEVNVPFSVGSVRAALAEPERVARCVPGLQLDSAQGTESTSGASAKGAGSTTEGRLRVRVGGSTITYRGSLTVTPRGEEFTVKGRGTEARGTGSVRLNLTVVPRRSKEGEGTRLVCSGTVKGDGRIEDFERKTAAAAGQRLLERFGKALGESIQENPPRKLDAPDAPAAEAATAEPTSGPAGGIGEPGDNDRVIPGIPGPDNRESQPSGQEEQGAGRAESESGSGEAASEAAEPEKSEDRDAGGNQGQDQDQDQGKDRQSPDQEATERGGVFGTEVPPSSLDPLHDDEPLDEAEVEAAAEAEAAHARRTMIGRSAEEVDHAPPRGRYAPVPVPQPIANSAALRWVAPAAAAVVAGAVVIGRVLRRRR